MQYSKILFASDLTALAAKGRNDATHIIVYEIGFYEWRSTGTVNGLTVLSATGGGVWYRIMTAGAAPAQLATPTGFAETGVTSSTVVYNWNDVASAANYIVERSPSGAGTFTQVYSGATSAYTDTLLSPATTYDYRVKAQAAGFIDSAYATDSATTSAATLITANRIAKWKFLEGAGQRAFNEESGNTADDNLIGFSEHYLAGQTSYAPIPYLQDCTVTHLYANNEAGLLRAARVVTTAGLGAGSGKGIYPQIALSVATHTFSVKVKSNTGSDQTFRLFYNGAYSAAKTALASGWSIVEFSFTGVASLAYYGLLYNTAYDALDILVEHWKINPGATATAYVEPQGDLFFGIYGNSEATDPTWNSRGLVLDGTQYANCLFSTPPALTALTINAVFKMSSTVANNIPIFLMGNPGTDSPVKLNLFAGARGSVSPRYNTKFRFGTTAGHEMDSRMLTLADNKVYMLTHTVSGTTIKSYLNGIYIQTVEMPGSSSFDLNSMIFFNNRTSGAGAVGFIGEMYDLEMFSVALSAAEVASQYEAQKTEMALKAVTLPDLDTFIVSEGDSISEVSAGGIFPHIALRLLTVPASGVNLAKVGSKVDGVVSLEARAALCDSYYDAARTNNILHFMIGVNDTNITTTDIAASVLVIYNKIVSYCNDRKATGWTVVVCTTTSKGYQPAYPDAITMLDDLNDMVRANWATFADALCDFAATAEMGAGSDTSNTFYFVDTTHHAEGGGQFCGALLKTALEAVIV